MTTSIDELKLDFDGSDTKSISLDNNLMDNSFKSGDKVVYTSGSLSLMNGIYKERCGKNRAKLLTKILNKYREIYVNNFELQKVI